MRESVHGVYFQRDYGASGNHNGWRIQTLLRGQVEKHPESDGTEHEQARKRC